MLTKTLNEERYSSVIQFLNSNTKYTLSKAFEASIIDIITITTFINIILNSFFNDTNTWNGI